MTSHKTISSLSIAAIALFAAAVPAFAQGQSAQSNRDVQSAVATSTSEQTITSSDELIAATNLRGATAVTAEVKPTAVKVTRKAIPMFSASAFKVQNNYTSMTSSRFVNPQVSFSAAGPSDPTAHKQFRADDDDSRNGIKSVTFVPSRGQKLPD